MKRNFLILVLCVVATLSSFSQNLQTEINGGLNFSKMKWMDSKLGFHAGVRITKPLDKEIAPGLYVNAGAFLSFKGGKSDWGGLGTNTINANYIDIPVHFGYKHALNENVKLFAEVGPYFSFGLFGKQKIKEIEDDWYDDYGNESYVYDNYSVSTFDNTLKRFDFGLGLRAGLEYNKIVFSIGYDAGMINIYKTDWDENDITGSVKSSNLYVSVGYIF